MFCPRCGNESDTSVRYCSKCGNDLSALTGAGQGGATTPIAAQPPGESETELVREALKEEYDLEKELGRGGMAVVYKARDKQLEREVAIKVLPFSLSFDAEFVERFQREARTAGKLEHPNIIPIYRVGKSGRVIYFVMKFIRGKSLSDVIEKRGALPVPEMKRLLIEASRALGYAHKHGIVHRDIKPDNIMFDEQGQAIVTDFGIAKAQSGAKLTGTGMSIGTPHYMSPEQARAQNLDGRSDIYSLGVVAYQCLTGHVPFDGEDSFSIGYKHIMEELPVPELATADQREVFSIVQRMMAKKPDDRFQNAEELVQSLEGAATGGGQDINTMRTLAIEPLKSPAKAPAPMTSAPTTPLPRASASMGKPKDTAPSPVPPPRTSEPSPKPSFKPKEVVEKKSKVPMAIAAVLGLAVVGGGGYVAYDKFVVGAAVASDSTPEQIAMAADTTHRADSSKAETTDTAKAETPDPTPPSRTPVATSRTPATTSRTPATPTTRTPAVTPPSRTPTTTEPAAPAAGQGTLSLTGTIPPGAAVKVDGQVQRGTRIKLAPGAHQVEITAQGFETYTNRVTIAVNQTLSVPVTMRATGAPSPAPGTPTTAAAPAAACAAPTVSLANRNRQCYDVRPNPRTSPVLPAPSSCTGNVTPSFILVQVSAAGEVVGQPAANRRSNCPGFDALAVAQVLDMTFSPATKGGQPVSAWVIVQMRPAR